MITSPKHDFLRVQFVKKIQKSNYATVPRKTISSEIEETLTQQGHKTHQGNQTHQEHKTHQDHKTHQSYKTHQGNKQTSLKVISA